MDENKLKVYRSIFDMVMQFGLSVASVLLVFYVTYHVIKNPTIAGGIVQAGVLTGTTYVVYKFFFEKHCPKCKTELVKP